MNDYTDDTLPRDIRDLAQALLDDPVTGSIIIDAGTHRNFTDEEGAVVIERCRQAPFMAPMPDLLAKGICPSSYSYNPLVAIGTARRVGKGEFASVNDIAAKRLIDENLVRSDDNDHVNIDPKYVPKTERKMSFGDYYFILKEFMSLPEFEVLDQQLRAVTAINGYDDDDFYEASGNLERPARKIMLRYGWINSCRFWEPAHLMISREIDFNNEQDAFECLTTLRGTQIEELE